MSCVCSTCYSICWHSRDGSTKRCGTRVIWPDCHGPCYRIASTPLFAWESLHSWWPLLSCTWPSSAVNLPFLAQRGLTGSGGRCSVLAHRRRSSRMLQVRSWTLWLALTRKWWPDKVHVLKIRNQHLNHLLLITFLSFHYFLCLILASYRFRGQGIQIKTIWEKSHNFSD